MNVCINYKCYIMIELTFLKELMLINVFHYWYFLDERFKFEANVCNGCHDVLMMSMKNDVYSKILILVKIAEHYKT